MSEIAQQAIVISNELGLHARAATKFVQLAGKYPCDVVVGKDGHDVNGKSIMGVLMLVASKGTTIVISAKGPQAADAVAALVKLVQDKFGEER
ncbi:MAG: HPr family phosphocarrier protein [Myxococcales bacterium]|nr:HPr family phosphocarrier protein [Myxococcales bacterium]MBK7198071.1 HPr family phosphocarrier protein [Myxococcales bacterium]MBP6845290.1 HPr family phosphocarrier protein [Kofleriaceae bacterium]